MTANSTRMPAHPTQQPRSCWSCGYDTSALSTATCPECGSDLSNPSNQDHDPTQSFMFGALAILASGFAALMSIGKLVANTPPGVPAIGHWAHTVSLGLAGLSACAGLLGLVTADLKKLTRVSRHLTTAAVGGALIACAIALTV